MSLLRNITSGLRSLFRKEQVDRELDEELRAYQEMAAEDKMKDGMSRKEALRAVRLERGNVEVTKQILRSALWESLLHTWWQDLRLGLRMLCKNLAFSSTVILILGLGIGMNSAIFTVANGFLLRKPPITDPSSMVMVTMTNPSKGRQRDAATPREFLALQRESHLFDEIAAVQLENRPLTGRGDPESVTVARVTPNYFALLGVPASRGRTFSPDRSQAEQEFNDIIGFDLWQRRFNADPAIIGKTLTLAGQIYTVIGIMPDEFKYAFVPCAVWIPDSFRAQPLSSGQTEKRDLNIFARLRTGQTLRDA